MNTKFTRQQYMNNECTHSEYYGQFVTQGHINKVAAHIGKDRIIKSTCPHFSDISLRQWDQIGAPSGTNEKMQEAGDSLTLSGQVCIAKEAARQIKEATKE